jgi:hypothetical protein
MFIVGSIAGWAMVTRAATSGKGKFVPQTRTTVPYKIGSQVDEFFVPALIFKRCKSILPHFEPGYSRSCARG